MDDHSTAQCDASPIQPFAALDRAILLVSILLLAAAAACFWLTYAAFSVPLASPPHAPKFALRAGHPAGVAALEASR